MNIRYDWKRLPGDERRERRVTVNELLDRLVEEFAREWVAHVDLDLVTVVRTGSNDRPMLEITFSVERWGGFYLQCFFRSYVQRASVTFEGVVAALKIMEASALEMDKQRKRPM